MAVVIGTAAIVLSGCTAGLPEGTSNATAAPLPSASPSPAPDLWTSHATGDMITARAEHTATLLPDGRVLVVGGLDSTDEQTQQSLASAELYDPSTGTWGSTGSMATPRARHTATLLPDGKVLVVGGYCGRPTKGCPLLGDPDHAIDPDGAISLAELYDPKTGTWSPTGSMTTTRFSHTATLLADGRVLVAGAEHGMPDAILASTEVYDPSTGRWTASGDMITARTQQFAIMLRDGKVLVGGGIGPISSTAHDFLVSAELYDPISGTWTATGNLLTPRGQGGTVAVLNDGKVLVAGGGGVGDAMLASSELYDPDNGSWTTAASMSGRRGGSASVSLPDGDVFVVGGFDVGNESGHGSETAELFDHDAATWKVVRTIVRPRFAHTGTLLADGQVLVAGGYVGDGVGSSAELYDPASGR